MKQAFSFIGLLLIGTLAFDSRTAFSQISQDPLRIVIRDGVIEPEPIALPQFAVSNQQDLDISARITDVVSNDLTNTGLFRRIPPEAYISIPGPDLQIKFADWKAISARALLVGSVSSTGSMINVNFRIYDVILGKQIGKGIQLRSDQTNWRRIAHKIADTVYQRITGELPYFDSRVAFISESGPKNNRRKQLAIMDYDGADVRNLTDGSDIVLSPRFSPDGESLIFTSYQSGVPSVYMFDLQSGTIKAIIQSSEMAFAPRFSPDGRKVVLSLTKGSNTDIYEVSLSNRQVRRLTRSAAIETAPSYSPDGKWLTFESDRSRNQQIYVMRIDGGEPRRISFGKGKYGTPVWSPTGDYIAFTKQLGGLFHLGVMRADGSEERILTSSFLDEGPTWSPNGRMLMFFRESPGPEGGPSIRSVDIYGRNNRQVPIPRFGSDPSWSPIRK